MKKVKVFVTQLCLALCDPMDCSPPHSSVHGIPREGYWSGLPLPSLGDLPNLGINSIQNFDQPNTNSANYATCQNHTSREKNSGPIQVGLIPMSGCLPSLEVHVLMEGTFAP